MLVESTHQLLHQPATAVTDTQLTDYVNQLKPIASLLIETIIDKNALGISACQLGVDMAMFAMLVDDQMRICINPQIVAASFTMELMQEGCLSFPNLLLKVRRPSGVMVRYHNLEGQEITEKLEGLAARVWLHEYDHVNGVCFTDRVGKLSLNMAKKRLAKKIKRNKK